MRGRGMLISPSSGGVSPTSSPALRQIHPLGWIACQPFVQPPPKLSSASARTRVPARRIPTMRPSFSVRSRTSTACPVTSPCFGNFASAAASSTTGGA